MIDTINYLWYHFELKIKQNSLFLQSITIPHRVAMVFSFTPLEEDAEMERFVSLMLALMILVFTLGCEGDHNPTGLLGPGVDEETLQPLAKVASSVSQEAQVVATVLGKDGAPMSDVDVAFSRSISGQLPKFSWGSWTNENGRAEFSLSPQPKQFWRVGAVGTYLARINDTEGRSIPGGEWGSIPINAGKEHRIVFTVGGSYSIETVDLVSGVTIAKNTAMADANPANPTAVIGASNIKLASIVVANNSREEQYLVQISMVASLPRVFQNLKVFFGNTQIGETAGTLTDSPVDFSFRSAGSMIMPAGSQAVLDLHADISSNVSAEDLQAVNNATDGGPFTVLSVRAVGMTSGETVQSQGEVRGQRVYLAEHGQFNIVKAGRSPGPQYVKAGDEFVVGGVYTIYALDESMTIQRFSPSVMVRDNVGANIQPTRVMENIQLYSSPPPFDVRDARADMVTEIWGGDWSSLLLKLRQSGIAVAQSTSRDIFQVFSVSRNAQPGTSIRFALFPLGYGDEPNIAVSGGNTAYHLGGYDVLEQPIMFSEIHVVAHAEERLLFPAIELDWSFAIHRDGYVRGFGSGMMNESLDIRVEFSKGLVNYQYPVRMVFMDTEGGIINLVSASAPVVFTPLDGGSDRDMVAYVQAWTGTHTQTELNGLGVQNRYYGRMMFFQEGLAPFGKMVAGGSQPLIQIFINSREVSLL